MFEEYSWNIFIKKSPVSKCQDFSFSYFIFLLFLQATHLIPLNFIILRAQISKKQIPNSNQVWT